MLLFSLCSHTFAGEGKKKGWALMRFDDSQYTGAVPTQPSIVQHMPSNPAQLGVVPILQDPSQYGVVGVPCQPPGVPCQPPGVPSQPPGVPSQPPGVPNFPQEGPPSHISPTQSSHFYAGTATTPDVQQHAAFNWLNHLPNSSYADDVKFDELQSLNSMTTSVQKSVSDQLHSNAVIPTPTALPYVYDPSAWLAYQGVSPHYTQGLIYHMPPLGFVASPQQPSMLYSQSPVANLPASSIAAVSPSPMLSVAPTRSSSPPPYEELPAEPIPLYKVRLQEILHTTRSRGPQYVNTSVEGGFACSAVVCGREFQTSKPYKNKKLGQYAVAYEALRWLEGSHNGKLRNCSVVRETCNDQSEDSVLVTETRKRKHGATEE